MTLHKMPHAQDAAVDPAISLAQQSSWLAQKYLGLRSSAGYAYPPPTQRSFVPALTLRNVRSSL